MYRSKGFVEDLKSGRWMLIPCALLANSPRIVAVPLSAVGYPLRCSLTLSPSLRFQIDAGTRRAVLESPIAATLRCLVQGHAQPVRAAPMAELRTLKRPV